MHFTTVELQIDGYAFAQVLAPQQDGDNSWSLALPLGVDGSLSVTGSTANQPPAFMMRALVNLQILLKSKVLISSNAHSEVDFEHAAESLPAEHVNLANALQASGSRTADAA